MPVISEQLKPIDTVNGFQIRPGFFREFGAVAIPGGVNFTIHTHGATSCELLLFHRKAEEPYAVIPFPESYRIGFCYSMIVFDLDIEEFEYAYRLDGPYDEKKGLRFDKNKILLDPYARAVTGQSQWGHVNNAQHGYRARVVQSNFDWGDQRHHSIPMEDLIIYELHVRGFTMDESSGVKHHGTFEGLREKIPYLKELGVNQIQCMPVYEFEECGKTKVNYWGYGKGFYFAPKKAYASGKSAVLELKDMVRACHSQGIEVVLEMPFVPGISANYVTECLRFYMLEYHVDGFVLNPYNVPWEQLIEDPFLKDIKLMQKDDGFQNVMRRFLKGDENMVNDVIWALKNRSSENGKCNYITTQTGFTLWDLVSYDCKHNEENGEKNLDGPDYNYSWNCGAEGPSRKRAVVNLRKNQVKNALELLLTAQGTPCLLAGDEFCNSQRGNNNAYCQDNETGWVNWTQLKKDDWLFQYIKKLIGLRKEHHCLHQSTALSGMDTTRCGIPDVSYHGENAWQVKAEVSSRQLGVLYSGTKEGELPCFTAYNMHWLPHHFAIPSIGKNVEWYLVMTTKDGVLCEAKKLENQKEVLLEERSVAILVGRKTEEKKSRSEKKPIHTVKTQNVNKIEKRQGAEELCKEEQPAREGKV